MQDKVEYTLFSMEGKVEEVEYASENDGLVACFNMDCSKGQDGGALTSKNGQVLGIHTGAVSLDGGEYYVATIL